MYKALRWAFRLGFEDAKLLRNEKARRIKLKAPCILTDLSIIYKIPLIVIMSVYKTINMLQNRKFPTKSTA
ncbi:MAG: hypothetical protein ACE5OW_02320, partial [Candidatus Bathyarchaeia archaeon]